MGRHETEIESAALFNWRYLFVRLQRGKCCSVWETFPQNKKLEHDFAALLHSFALLSVFDE